MTAIWNFCLVRVAAIQRRASKIRCRLALCLLALLLAACEAGDPAAQYSRPTRNIPTLFPTAATQPSAPPPGQGQPSDTGWMAGDEGVALRRLRVSGGAGRSAIPLIIVRLDPAKVRLRVAYDPNKPRLLRAWFDERRPLLAINGGFFDEAFRSTALVISDGAASGASYEGFGGMLGVAPDGSVMLRSLHDQPYDTREELVQAMQSFPMLVSAGGVPAAIEEDGQRARRTAVALDRDGRVLLIVSPTSSFTLRGLADWLSRSDLNLDRALNLDGGSSTGLFLKAGTLQEEIDSLGALPLVLLVERR
jgi:uncharacterized protein YigE (DUF2233 family)